MNKQKILIVDDDANIAELIALYLTKECFDTRMVHDGEMALEVFDNYQPNLIILDLMLPGIDGYQVCREIRAKSNTPIIMLSAAVHRKADRDRHLPYPTVPTVLKASPPSPRLLCGLPYPHESAHR